MSECIGPRLALPTTRPSAAGCLPPRSNRGGPTRTCAYVLDEVALLPVHDGSAHNADNVSRSPTSGMRTATVGGGCRAPRTDPAMARAGCQRSSTSRAAGSAEGSEPHWHPGSCCICSIAPRRAPEVGRPRLRPGRTLMVRGRLRQPHQSAPKFEARGCRRQLRGCDRPKNLGHSLRLTGPIKTWVIPPEEVKQRPAGHFFNALPGIF